MFTVETNVAQGLNALLALKAGLEKKATSRALNRVIQMARTDASKTIRQQYAFKAAEVKATMRIFNASQYKLEATLNSKGKRTPLIKMGARQKAKGVSVKIGKQRKLIKGAFIATMKSGHTGVFIRLEGTVAGKRGKPILNRKIKELYTIGVPEAFGARVVSQSMVALVKDKFPERLQHEIEWLMKQRS